LNDRMDGRARSSSGRSRLTPKQIVGMVVAVMLLVLIVVNFDDTHVDFVVVDVTLPLAVVILISGLLGGVAGWAAARRAHKQA
jgi:uncharacterized integral membrane protein